VACSVRALIYTKIKHPDDQSAELLTFEIGDRPPHPPITPKCMSTTQRAKLGWRQNLLYDLINLPQFSLLLIVNREEDLLDGLDDRLASRLGGVNEFPSASTP